MHLDVYNFNIYSRRSFEKTENKVFFLIKSNSFYCHTLAWRWIKSSVGSASLEFLLCWTQAHGMGPASSPVRLFPGQPYFVEEVLTTTGL